jgi:hypothetical protein
MRNSDNLIVIYIYFAAALVFGAVLVFLMLFLSQRFGIDIFVNWWMLVLPVILATILDVVLIELYRHFKKR